MADYLKTWVMKIWKTPMWMDGFEIKERVFSYVLKILSTVTKF